MSNSQPGFPLDFHYAYGKPDGSAGLKAKPEYFQVNEVLGFEPVGEGEHLYLQIEKCGRNSADIARELAKHFGIRALDVGYAGMKDKHAVTQQWFSLYLPKTPDAKVDGLQIENTEVLASGWHQQKLRRGQHQANQFRIVLTELEADAGLLKERMEAIAERGVPNYFGPQRFGIEGNNLVAVNRWFVEKRAPRNRSKKGIYLSSARSYLFNRVLSERVADGSWENFELGDVTISEGNERPTGPLWGRGRLATSGRIAEIEQAISDEFAEWCHGLEYSGLHQERRPLCLPVDNLNWSLEGDQLQLDFSLQVGCYATSVIREICHYRDQSRAFDVTER